MARYEFETIEVTSPSPRVLLVELNRPEIYNALNQEICREIGECFKRIHDDRHCRAVVIAGSGKHFSSGLDYTDLVKLIERVSRPASQVSESSDMPADIGRKAKFLNGLITDFQEYFNAIEVCSKPVIAAIYGNCIGAAFSILGATDVRYAAKDTNFTMKGVDIGVTPDMGALQRVPKAVGNQSLFKEMIFSAKPFTAEQAEKMGLISTTFEDREATREAAIDLAKIIATKSPVAVQGTKVCWRYSRDHTVYDGLRFMANWNMTMYQSEDLIKAVNRLASKSKNPPDFQDL